MPPSGQPQQAERYPYPSYNFKVTVTDVDSGETVSASFSEVSGLTVDAQPIEYRDGTDDSTIRMVPGPRKLSNITLKRGLTDHGFWRWVLTGSKGDVDRQQGYIALLNEDRVEVMRWNFDRARPTGYTSPGPDAENNEIAMETLELMVEDLRISR